MTLPPGWRRYSELSDEAAASILRDYAAAVLTRATAFIAQVRRLGGPSELLTYDRQSLVPLWTWFVATQRLPETPATEDEMREANPPWWFDFHPPLGRKLGPQLAELVTNMSAYFVACILRERPQSQWAVGPDPNGADYKQPLLYVEGNGMWGLDLSMVAVALQALDGRGLGVEPARLLNLYDLKVHPPAGLDAAKQSSPLVVLPEGTSGFTHRIEVNDAIAHEEEARVIEFIGRLPTIPGVVAAHHEDREVILVSAPGLSDERLRDRAMALWAGLRVRVQ